MISTIWAWNIRSWRVCDEITCHAYGNAVTNDLWRALEELQGFGCGKFSEALDFRGWLSNSLTFDDGSMA
jgi:hypothetical protein